MIYTEKDVSIFKNSTAPTRTKKKNSYWCRMKEVLLQAEVRREESSNQNFQAETIDRFFSSLGVCLRVIISWILCFLFFFREKTPCTRDWEQYVLVLFSTIQMTLRRSAQQHNKWFWVKSPTTVVLSVWCQRLSVSPGHYSPYPGLWSDPRQNQISSSSVTNRCCARIPLIQEKKERKKASKLASKQASCSSSGYHYPPKPLR